MTATALPESGQTIPSLPRSLYLGAHDRPHWSQTDDTFEGRRRASSVRSVETARRRQLLAAIHDSLHYLRAAATAIGNLDRNGLTLAAADNIECSLEHTASSNQSLVGDMRMAAALYTEAELRASTPPVPDESPEEPEEDSAEALIANGYSYVCKEHDFYVTGGDGGEADDDTDRAIEDHEQQHRDAEDLAEREAEDLDAAADARATDQVITALAARVAEVMPSPAEIAARHTPFGNLR